MPRSASSPLAARAWVAWCVALALAACLPVLVAHYPQMSDYPAHLARYHVMLDAGRTADLARNYVFEWKWTGNLGVDLLIRPFAALFGLEAGGRIIVGLIAVVNGLGIIAVDVALRRRVTIASPMAFAFIWQPMFAIGLINYALGQAAALWAFALWVELGRRGRAGWGRNALFAGLGMVVWLCHLSAWGMLGLMVFGYEWSLRKSWRAFLAPWPLLMPLVAMALTKGTSADIDYGPFYWIYKRAIWERALRDSNSALDHASLWIVGAWIVAGILSLRWDGRLGWAAVLLLAGSFAVPRHISGGDYVDYRMITSGLMVAVLAVRWRRDGTAPRWVMALAPALYLARLAVTTLTWQADSAETAHLLTALDQVPRGASVASAVLVPREDWKLDHFEHIGAYAVVRRDALSNANFAVAHIHMLHLRRDGWVDPSQRMIRSRRLPLDLSLFAPAKGADYLWYVGEVAPARLPAGAVVVWRWRQSLLARLPKPAPLAKSGKAD